MDSVATILTSSNLIPLSVVVLVLLLTLAILSEKGIVSFSGHGLKVGSDETERTIIRQQIEYAASICETFPLKMSELIKNEYKTKFISERMFDKFIEIISFNHISLEPTYVQLKQEALWGIVCKEAPELSSLETIVKQMTEEIIKKLVEIRKYYSN